MPGCPVRATIRHSATPKITAEITRTSPCAIEDRGFPRGELVPANLRGRQLPVIAYAFAEFLRGRLAALGRTAWARAGTSTAATRFNANGGRPCSSRCPYAVRTRRRS